MADDSPHPDAAVAIASDCEGPGRIETKIDDATMIVELRSTHSEYPELTAGQPYLVLGIEADDFRILNDQGRPYLYPSKIFQVADDREPADWVTEFGEERERYAYPPTLNGAGFFEDFFEGKPEAVAAFWRVMNQGLASTICSTNEIAPSNILKAPEITT